MKEQYVGDIGDFGKVLILKHLAESGFILGVNWLLTHNDDGADGRLRDYIDYSGKHCLCCCDPLTFKAIAPLARAEKTDRKISDLEEIVRSFAPEITFNSEYFSNGLVRKSLDQAAFEKSASAGLVFFDPDNGIDFAVGTSAKHVYLPDLKRYWAQGQSLLIYHHLNRVEPHANQISRIKSALKEEFCGSSVLHYRLCRGTTRAYFLCLQRNHLDRMKGRESILSIRPLEMTKAQWAKMAKICGRVHI